jgi:hypothetical protein
MRRWYLQHRHLAAASSANEMVKCWRPRGLRSPVALVWSSTSDDVSHDERGSGCATQRRWKVASMVLNAAESSTSGAVAIVCSSLVTIGSAVSPCGKKVVETDGVLRFVVQGARLRPVWPPAMD